jgi:hypothetical protein
MARLVRRGFLDTMPGKGGRPPKVRESIDHDQVAALAGDGCTIREIADILGVAFATMADLAARPPLVRIIYHARAERRKRLRTLQWKAADKLNPALLIWLGKQELEQHEPVARHEIAASVDLDAEDPIGDRLARLAVARRTNGDGREAHTNGKDGT